MLIRLIYSSNVARNLDARDIEDILESSRKRNPEEDITGMLCYGGGKFMQYVEGERHTINDLYNRLIHDPRHKSVLLLDYLAIDKREFSDWSMGYVSASAENVNKIIEETTGQHEFRPEILDAQQAADLIKKLKVYLEE